MVPDGRLAKIKGEPKPQSGQQRRLHLFDRVLGYRIEDIGHPALWGRDQHWQAVTFDGKVLRNRTTRRAIFGSPAEAVARAEEHAKEHLPKVRASQRWASWSWTGGADYREWLITLPWYPESYFSSHFSLRNILVHVRCDVREGGSGEKVLMLQEVQSDWAQQTRRVRRDGDEDGLDPVGIAAPPFLAEWPSLALKLVFLHASHLGMDAVVWTHGEHQAHRYKGLGEAGLRELYDRTLPREANRILKPFDRVCESIEVYVPANFGIRRVEDGYEVHTSDGRSFGVAQSMDEARELLPDGAHELLWAVHGVRLDNGCREAIQAKGFFAWG